MRRTVLKSKIHRATVTDADLHYEGSLTIDQNLLDAADILPHEQIHVWDVTSGARLITYALSGPRGSGIIQVNGAGAHLIKTGNLVIIATFTQLRTKVAKRYVPAVVFVDAANKIREGQMQDDETTEEAPTLPEEPEAEAPLAPPAPVKRVRRRV